MIILLKEMALLFSMISVALIVRWRFHWLKQQGARLIARWTAGRRRKQFAEQFPECLIHIASALKAGLALEQAADLVSRELSPPLSEELSLVVSHARTGKTIEEAFAELARRMPMDDVVIAAGGISVLMQSGGNLAETFERMAETIAERSRVAGKIRSLTAQGMSQACILLLLPFFLLVALAWVSPEYVTPLFVTHEGWALLSLGVIFEVVGAWFLKRIVTIEV